MKIIALLAVRNEAAYIETCLRHLIAQGLQVILIDNESNDDTVSLSEKFLNKGLLAIETLPFEGEFQWSKLLQKKEALARTYVADWYMHCDADEIKESPFPNFTLSEAVAWVDAQGFNAINFEEFVFLPTDKRVSYVGRDYVREMKYYYYYAPRPLARVNLWKAMDTPVNLVASGGHAAEFQGRKVFPVPFILRHYIALSWEGLVQKYARRRFPRQELKRGWHRQRAGLNKHLLRLPKPQACKVVDGQGWDTTCGHARHLFYYPPRSLKRMVFKPLAYVAS